MASLIWLPPTTGGGVRTVTLDAGGVVLMFEPGIPRDVPAELLAAAQTALRAGSPSLASPTPSIAVTGAAAGTQTYQVVATNGNGDTTPSSTASTDGGGPTTLDGTHYNTLSWAAALGATGYKVIRLSGGPSQGLIATLPRTSLSFPDTGVPATVYTPAGAAVSQAGVIAGPPEI
jgi:hypothetical protein